MNIDKEKLDQIEAKLYAILDEIKEYKKAFEKKIDVTKFKCLKTLGGRSGDVFSVAYSPDGTRAVHGIKPLRYGMQTQENALKPWRDI